MLILQLDNNYNTIQTIIVVIIIPRLLSYYKTSICPLLLYYLSFIELLWPSMCEKLFKCEEMKEKRFWTIEGFHYHGRYLYGMDAPIIG